MGHREVVRHEPEHHRSRVEHSEVVRKETVTVRESHHGEPVRHVTKREPEIRREYIDIHGNKSSHPPVYGDHHEATASHVHHESKPVHHESKVVSHHAPVHHEPRVVSHHAPVHHESRVVSHHAPVHGESKVVSHHHHEEVAHHQPAPTVIRRSVHDQGHHNVVRKSGNVVRRSVVQHGDHHNSQVVSHGAHNVVRRSHHDIGHANVVRRSVHDGGHHGGSRVVSHAGGHHGAHQGSTVRRITDPEEIRKIKEANGMGTRHENVVECEVERVHEDVVECEVVRDHHDEFADEEVIVVED